jgi:hypothetical protein
MSAKKTSSKPSSTFILSASKCSYEEDTSVYIGKMRSNLLGDVLNIYGPGLNPENAKNANVTPRELLATISYDTRFFQMGKPRGFQVFLKKS